MFEKLKSLFKKPVEPSLGTGAVGTGTASSSSAVKVGFDESCIWVESPDNDTRSLSWSDLIGVAVETTDQGLFVEDVYWLLATKDEVAVYPDCAEGAKELLERLQELPDFNNGRLIEAMACTTSRVFLLWDHEGEQNE